MAKIVKEKMEPMSGPDMVRHDDFITKHSHGGHVHHKEHSKKHAAGHEHEMDKVARMCKGGKV